MEGYVDRDVIAQIALKKGLITQKQFDEAAGVQMRTLTEPHVYLLLKGSITHDQVIAITNELAVLPKKSRIPALAAAMSLALAAYLLGPCWVEIDGKSELRWPAFKQHMSFVSQEYDAQEVDASVLPWMTHSWNPEHVPSFGQVAVTTTPPGAQISFLRNGTEECAGIANGSPLKIRKGTYELKIRHPDCEDNAVVIHVLPTEMALNLDLPRKTGTLAITCNVEDAIATIDTKRYILPADPIALEIGKHEVSVEKENFVRVRRVVTIGHAQTAALDAYLLPSCCDISAAIISPIVQRTRILLLCWRK